MQNLTVLRVCTVRIEMRSSDTNQQRCNCRGVLTPCLKPAIILMCLFIECARGYHNSSLSSLHLQRASSSLSFHPFLFDPTLPPVLLLIPALFFLLGSFQPSSLMHSFSLSLLPPSPVFPLSSFLFRSLSFISAPLLPLDALPPSILSSSSLHPSIPPSSGATDRVRDLLIAWWCRASVRLVINGLCCYWYMANTSKKSNTSHQPSQRRQEGSSGVCCCLSRATSG